MTDTEIVRACGEAMGWTTGDPASSHWRGLGYYADGKRVASADWNPLTSDADWAQVLDALSSDRGVELTWHPDSQVWWCNVAQPGETVRYTQDHGTVVSSYDECRRRVVCIAFLKARGLWEEEP